MHLSVEQIRELFRTHNVRCTHQREMVYGGLAATPAHPTAEELYHTLHATDPNISLATVYNSLDALSDVGLVRKVPSGLGPCRYDAETEPHVHVSTPDGRVMDAPLDLSERLLRCLPRDVIAEIERRMGVSIARVNVQMVADGEQRRSDASPQTSH